MAGIRRRSLALATLLVFVISGVALAAPSFSDQNIAKGNLNPTDRILVQEIRITGDSSRTVTISSVNVRNWGTAGGGQIDKIEIWDGGTKLGQITNMTGLDSGIMIPVTYNIAAGSTHYLEVYVTVGTTVNGGETVLLQIQFYYEYEGGTGQSHTGWISDLTGEAIRKGGFDQTSDTALDAAYFNPTNTGQVQIAVFTDNDANGNNVLWTQTGSNKILEVENLGTGTTSDIDQAKVTLNIADTNYSTNWINWAPTSPMRFDWDDFTGLPVQIPDNSSATVTVEMKIRDATLATDGRTIRTRVTLYVSEGGQDYVQSVTSGTTQTIRKQGFETIAEQSTHVTSGTKATGEYLEQIIKVTDDDVNGNQVQARAIHVTNMGSAAGSELTKIEVKTNSTTLATVTNAAELANFKAGMTIDFTPTKNVADDGNLTIKIYYHIGTPEAGHTLRPKVKVRGREPHNGTADDDYWSNEVTYPDTIALYTPGFEIVENVTPPEGGTAYSGQRLLAQTIRALDKDENDGNVAINPVVVKNMGTARENPDVVKIEVMRRDTEGGTPVLMGGTTTLTGFRTSGVTIPTQQNNIVTDSPGGTEVFIDVYVTIASPENMVAGRTLQLETRILHSETAVGYDKKVTGNQWTLAINHRPTCDFDYTPSTNLTYETEITFTAKNVSDVDGDDIVAHRWEFSDGGTGSGTSVKHTFAAGGTVWAKLTVEDARGLTGSKTKTFSVEPPPVVPAAQFTWAPQAPATGEEVTFTGTSTTPTGTTITDRSWDLDGDGTEDSDAENPTHTYTAPGTYEVSLTVTNSDAQTDTVTHEVEVPAAKPTADFDYSPPAPNVRQTITFEDKSTAVDPATIETWAWDFGDDSTSTDQDPTHTYTTMGTYTVSLTVTDSNEETSNAHTEEIVVGPATMVYSYPNPASDAVTIVYRLPEGATDPVLRIFDLVGRLVRQEDLDAAQTAYAWDLTSDGGTALPNGLYVCVVTAQNANERAIKSQLFKLLIDR